MTKSEYHTYLKSDHWKNVKVRYFSSKRPKVCDICGSDKEINLHHKTYTRLGHEYLTDLIVLCRDCHEAVHSFLKSKDRPKNITLIRAVRKIKQRFGLRRRKAKQNKISRPKIYQIRAKKKVHKFLSTHPLVTV
jgi:hypothetical protein